MATKSTSSRKKNQSVADDLKPEYQFDYSKAKPNRFAKEIPAGAVAVILDPDVAEVFQSAESVNAVLRALLTTMPANRQRRPG